MRLRQVPKEVCSKNKTCEKDISKQQRKRGGNCMGRGNANAQACNKLADGRIVGTEKGLGSNGQRGGKVLSKKTTKGYIASLAIGGILLNGADQKADPDYIDGERTYVVEVLGKSRQTGQTKPIKGVKVILTIHSKNGEKTGCRNNGTGSGVFTSQLSDVTGEAGAVGFENCSHQQISIKLENIPKGYKNIVNNGGAVVIRSAQDKDLNATFDNGRITITLEEAQPQPKKNKKEDCTKIAQKALSKEKYPLGSYSNSGGSKVTYFDNSRFVKVHDIMGVTANDRLDIPASTSKECQEQISHSRTYVVRAYTVTHPRQKGKDVKRVNDNFSVELLFNGPGSCKTANPGKSGTDNAVVFRGCSRNQIDIKMPSPNNHPVVFKYQSKAGYVKVKGSRSKSGSTVYIDVFFENELKRYSNADFAKFVGAANKYWWERRMEGANNGHPQWGVHNAKCKPWDVSIRYENQAVKKTFVSASRGDEVAEASGLYTAYEPKTQGQCFIRINSEGKWMRYTDNKRYACMIYVHEYGHLLGYGHTQDSKNIMHPYPWSVDKSVWQKTGC